MCGRKWIISQAAGARRVSAEELLASETLEEQEEEIEFHTFRWICAAERTQLPLHHRWSSAIFTAISATHAWGKIRLRDVHLQPLSILGFPWTLLLPPFIYIPL